MVSHFGIILAGDDWILDGANAAQARSQLADCDRCEGENTRAGDALFGGRPPRFGEMGGLSENRLHSGPIPSATRTPEGVSVSESLAPSHHFLP